MRRDLGDFQTPPELARLIVQSLAPVGTRWSRVLEPTCGTGAFLQALLQCPSPPRELIGIEIQESHLALAQLLSRQAQATRLSLLCASLFEVDLRRDLPWRGGGPLLVLGNPPWITAAALGKLGSTNQPSRRNLKELPGIEALTGGSNFDIAEAVWIKLLEELVGCEPTIALLCKMSVARDVLEFAAWKNFPIISASIHQIDAKRWFGAAASACLLRVHVGGSSVCQQVPIFASLGDPMPTAALHFHGGRLIAGSNIAESGYLTLGKSPMCWRQGIKHDAAAIMELTADEANGTPVYRNGLGDQVDVEPEFLYPLLKGADLRRAPAQRPRRAVIITQTRLGQDTSVLEHRAPRLWTYLQRHAARLSGRKSSIYRHAPAFALFGVGPYSFALFKVAVSGLHRPALFRAIGSVAGQPIMLDDTCYLLPCAKAVEAAVVTALWLEPAAQSAVAALSFADAKRPVTKGLLQRISISAILDQADRPALLARAQSVLREQLELPPVPTDEIDAELQRLDREWNRHAGV
ncbi:MAG: SAM-dependent DNA methyltransferase [Planctomycetaceae bacterium]|nr:SAM-dependent DNA methyltransferase [Planctomycetaceae bacterium]